MDIGTISSRYAKALFSLAKDKEQESRVYDDMKMLADSFSMEPELRGCLLYTSKQVSSTKSDRNRTKRNSVLCVGYKIKEAWRIAVVPRNELIHVNPES